MTFFELFKKRKKKRVLLIGLDGVPYSLLKRLVDRGVMKNVGEILKEKNLYQMDASIPEVSSVSWASFMTASNPAEHGIFGFTDFKDYSYSIMFPNYLSLKKETIWDNFSKKGMKSYIINMPQTYPAREHNGILISGFVAIDLKKAVYPPWVYDKLEKFNYKIDVDTERAQDKEYFYNDLFDTLEKRGRVFKEFIREDWDFFAAIITETDRLQHFEYEVIDDENGERFEKALKFYEKIDALLGEIVNELKGEDELFILSDHGFTKIKEEVYINAILRENGFLKFENGEPDFKNIDEKSVAFALDPSRIYIHKRNRFPKGRIEEKEIESLKKELKEFFLSIERNGEKVIKKVCFKEEIYRGKEIEKAPDMVLISNYGYDLKGNIKSKEIFKKTHFTGMHTRDDAFLICDKKLDFKPDIEYAGKLIIDEFNR